MPAVGVEGRKGHLGIDQGVGATPIGGPLGDRSQFRRLLGQQRQGDRTNPVDGDAQRGCFGQRSANLRCRLQQQKLPRYGLSSPPGGFRSLRAQEASAALQAFRRALGDDYLWHAGTALSSSVPQVFNQARTSWPVR